jgi:hypothetical protein
MGPTTLEPTLLLVVDELGGLRRLLREALALPDLLDEWRQHVRGDGLPELEAGVPVSLPAITPIIVSLRLGDRISSEENPRIRRSLCCLA